MKNGNKMLMMLLKNSIILKYINLETLQVNVFILVYNKAIIK